MNRFFEVRRIFRRIYQLCVFYSRGGVAYARLIGVQVGEDCRIYTNKFGSEPEFISIGSRVTITQGVVFLTHDGSTWLFRDDKGRRYLFNNIRIGSNVFVGVNSVLMPGIIIEDDVIVGAGSVVTKSVPKGSVVAGNPAKIIGETKYYRDKALREFLNEATLGDKSHHWVDGDPSKKMME